MKRLLIAMALVAAACTPDESPPPTPEAAVQDHVASLWSADTRTVLTGDAARVLARQCSRISPGPVEGAWTPSDADVADLEGELIQLVASQLVEEGHSPSPGDYYRQYAGFVIGGRRVIYVNGVADSAVRSTNPNQPFDWRTQAVQICDGGTVTFGVEYDPQTRQFSNFAFNGALD